MRRKAFGGEGEKKERTVTAPSHYTAWNQTVLDDEQGQGGSEKTPKALAVIKIIILL